MNTYSIPKPKLSPAAWLLGAAVSIGLFGLGLVAFHVFGMVDNPVVAACFALVIELGAVSEAIGIIRKNRPAIAGAAVSLAVSISYNVTRIEAAGLNLTGWQSWALAIGPLSAVLFLALSLSHELQAHETAVKAWEAARQAWQDDQAEKARKVKAEAEERARQEQQKREQEERAASLEAKRLELEYQDKQARRTERTAARAAKSASGTRPGVMAQDGTTAAQVGTYAEFSAAQMARNGAGPMTYQTVMARFKVSKRTAFRWLAQYEHEHQAPSLTESVN